MWLLNPDWLKLTLGFNKGEEMLKKGKGLLRASVSKLKTDNGSILFILVIMVAMGVSAAFFMQTVSNNTDSAVRARDRSQIHYALESSLELTLDWINKEQKSFATTNYGEGVQKI